MGRETRKKGEKRAARKVEEKRVKKLLKDVKEYRKSKRTKTKIDIVVDEAGEKDGEDRECYTYDEMHLAFSSQEK